MDVNVYEIPSIFNWEIRLHKPELYSNPDWHGIQAAIVKEFGDALWDRIKANVFAEIELILLSWIKVAPSHQILTAVTEVARSLAPEAKAALNQMLWEVFPNVFWQRLRDGIEGLIKRGTSSWFRLWDYRKMTFTLGFEVSPGFFRPEWQLPQPKFVLKNTVLEGILNISVSLDARLGSPMN